MEILVGIILFAICFFLGSVPWGLIISTVFYKKDIRSVGSGNIGTTNAMRALGKVGGAAVFVLDFGKGVASGFIGIAMANAIAAGTADPATLMANFKGIAFLACVWGHIFSPWLGFKGGKGIAVAVGCLFGTFGFVGACLNWMVFIILVPITKYVSVGSIASAVACPFFAAYYFLFQTFAPFAFVCVTLGALTVIWAHRGNIERLRTGTERRIGQKKEV